MWNNEVRMRIYGKENVEVRRRSRMRIYGKDDVEEEEEEEGEL